ncbi:MAG: MFS transporter [Dehalococcoidia bacterium]
MATAQQPPDGNEPQEGSIRHWLRLFLSLHLPAMAMGMGLGLSMPVLPEIAQERFGVSVEVAALVFIVYLIGTAAAPLPTGIIIDRMGRRKILVAGPIIVAVSAALTVKAVIDGTFTELLVYRFIAGWGEQMWLLSRLTVIADTGSSAQRGKQVTSMFGVQQAGAFLGPVIGGFTATLWGLWVPFAIQAVIILLAFTPTFYLMRETAPSLTAGATASTGRPASTPSGSWKTLKAHPIPLVLLVQFLANITRGGVFAGGVIFLYGSYAYGATPAELGSLRGVMGVIGIPLTFTVGFIMDRYGRKVTIVPGLALAGTAMLFMASTAYAALPFSAFIAAFIAVHLAINLITGNMQTLGSDIAPPGARGRFFGVSRLTSQTGSVISPTSFALLSGLAGFGVAFTFLSSTALVASVLVAVFVRETLQRRPKEEARPEPAVPRA